jgi:AcrR family transcriptional regulator
MAQAVEPHPASSREHLLDIAERHFAARGYAAVTLKDIARDLGIRQPSIYYHVPGGKEDLYVEVMMRHLERHRAGMERAIAGAGPLLEDRLHRMAEWMLEHPPVDVGRMADSDLPEMRPEIVEQIETSFHRCVFDPIEAVFEDARREGRLRLPYPRQLSRVFFSNMITLAAARKYWSQESTQEQVIGGHLDILLHGLLARTNS